jgi:N-acetylmuramic acid 6-phosphate etherase
VSDTAERNTRETEAADARYHGLDAWPIGQVLAAVLESNRRAAEAAHAAQDALGAAAAGIEARLARGGRLVYIGAGTSGRLALQDAAELPPTFGFGRTVVLLAGGDDAEGAAVENAEDDAEGAVRAVEAAEVGPDDAVIGLAASGRTPYTLAGVRRARELGAFTVGIANNAGAPLLAAAHVGILLETGPEVLAGSTRLAAGTAQKIALNALSTAVLVRLGGAYDNLMVGMKPQNAKLRERAAAIVAQAARVARPDAEAALEGSGWRIREAVVMLRAGVDMAAAQAVLEAHHGRIRDALEALGERG